MKTSTMYLIALAVTALAAGASRSTQAEDQQLNDLLWLKRLIGVPMLLVGAAYAYWSYVLWKSEATSGLADHIMAKYKPEQKLSEKREKRRVLNSHVLPSSAT